MGNLLNFLILGFVMVGISKLGKRFVSLEANPRFTQKQFAVYHQENLIKLWSRLETRERALNYHNLAPCMCFS
jgi:hypothetical protein